MTVVDVNFDYTRTFTTDTDTVDVDAVNRLFAEMEGDALRDLAASAIPTEEVQFQWFYDAAYWGQAHELIVPLTKGASRTWPTCVTHSTTSTSASTPSRWKAIGSISCTGA